MHIGLGLDTGGTYTDGVLYRFSDRKILQSGKALTRKEDLTVGINQVLDQLDQHMLMQVDLVALSTTLATNACVENKGGYACLILIGCDPLVIKKYGHENGLPPVEDMILLEGGHNMTGQLLAEPDWQYLKQQTETSFNLAEAFAVVELWGVRNSTCELKAKELLHAWTGKPVVCGHEISGTLNSLRRAASALLNARLLPLINTFLDAVRNSLAGRKITAPLVIVRSDGSLMAESVARERPVETLLSGPAASVAGGLALTGLKSGIVVDMGGTTSDVAMVRDGQPVMAAQGAQIGTWRTGIHSILIQTVGLGGDSLIRHQQNQKLVIGPRRAAPLSWAAQRWPQILEALRALKLAERKHTLSLAEFFYRVERPAGDTRFTRHEQRILDVLRDGPLSLSDLAEKLNITIYDLRTERLEQQDLIMRCGLTPTDVMHLTGEYRLWQQEAAELAADILAFQLAVDRNTLIADIQNKVKEMLGETVLRMLLEQEYAGAVGHDRSDIILLGKELLRRHMKAEKADQFLQPVLACSVPLIGIGAPIHLYLPTLAQFMQTPCHIPHYAAVANAVGAITGQVVVTSEALIKPRYAVSGITGYDGFSKTGTCHFKAHAAALLWARAQAETEARGVAAERGAERVDVQVSINKREVPVANDRVQIASEDTAEGLNAQIAVNSGLSVSVYLETVVQARAIGRINRV